MPSPYFYQSGAGGGEGSLDYDAINGLPAETSIETTDLIVVGDVSATSADKATLANVILGGAATQAEQETGSATNRIVTPGRQQYHPSAAKAWCNVTYSAGTPTNNSSFGVSSLTDQALGVLRINLSTAFSSTSFSPNAASQKSSTNSDSEVSVITNSTSQIEIQMFENNVATDPVAVFCQAFGDQ